ncbi:hypothetical protein CEXT_128171 [Caerostris extrusa]|uniref:Uncharacterized protein n=1 Tax=Caerostris extrusa TaxID=172846 RepID=A0AAV4UTR5_CAEEX|nr:hypothetical protein CEXT_128171 [Caerostris extrusa]
MERIAASKFLTIFGITLKKTENAQKKIEPPPSESRERNSNIDTTEAVSSDITLLPQNVLLRSWKFRLIDIGELFSSCARNFLDEQ